jgi:hypothetical protein
MKLRPVFTSIVACSALLGGLQSQPLPCWGQSKAQATDNTKEVPFQLHGGHGIVVRGSIGDLKNISFLVDTGAVPGVLDSRIARKLHLQGETVQISALSKTVPVQWVDAPDVRLGPRHSDKLRVVVRDLSFASDLLGTRIDAMIGFDLLGQSSFTIDYEAKKIVFGPIDPSLVAIPYHPGLPFAVVDLQIQGEKLAVLVDTGASDLLLFNSALGNCRSSIKVSSVQTGSNMGGEMQLSPARLTGVSLGVLRWEPRKVYVVQDYGQQPFGLAGMLGTMMLSTKRVAFDQDRNLVAWAPSKEQQ